MQTKHSKKEILNINFGNMFKENYGLNPILVSKGFYGNLPKGFIAIREDTAEGESMKFDVPHIYDLIETKPNEIQKNLNLFYQLPKVSNEIIDEKFVVANSEFTKEEKLEDLIVENKNIEPIFNQIQKPIYMRNNYSTNNNYKFQREPLIRNSYNNQIIIPRVTVNYYIGQRKNIIDPYRRCA